jgi:hypothetical protein
MRDIRATPTAISDALHGGASLDNTAGRSLGITGKSPERLDCGEREVERATMLHLNSLQPSERYAGQRIHGPNSS